ncbi:MAG: hypothetical protein HYV63_32200 [Candidatus Schekmanbacteria bacterium]|nr:hypothetical protein [Candidatus Schekmanbacteria bacterium]
MKSTHSEGPRTRWRQRSVSTCGLLAALILIAGPAHAGFKAEQMRYARVRAAYDADYRRLARAFSQVQATFPPRAIYLRAFKVDARCDEPSRGLLGALWRRFSGGGGEAGDQGGGDAGDAVAGPGSCDGGILELWAPGTRAARHELVAAFPICAASGGLGPKRRRGDWQVPEGLYAIDRFNPVSSYHLSLGVTYPNAADRIRSRGLDPGGDIFIHGKCASIGCLAMTDRVITLLYIAAVEAREQGQARIPVHIFPTRLEDAKLAELAAQYAAEPELVAFWRELRPAYEAFERTRLPPKVTIDASGHYTVLAASPGAGHH